MPYLIETFDRENSYDRRLQLRDEHLRYLETVADKLLACGAKLSEDGETADGGIYLVDVDTRDEAEALIEADPFHQGDLFREVKIQRWRKAYLDGRSYL
ncbi:YciI family protein [Kocuria flava]|uniref:YciI family protein n=1 Tax=Kocuria flava TaxID=446860 RepID=UPI001FF5C9EE|nr:YciI family protein [Kocuria flava]MCJ8503472.1 YciI family protein [Kocuria flava]